MKYVWRRKVFKQFYSNRCPSVIVSVTVLLVFVWILGKVSESINNVFVQSPSPNPLNVLSHFRRNRSLQYYFDNIELLIEPSSPPCTGLEEVPVLAMVASAPGNWQQRQAIRDTWGKHLPSFFILGLEGKRNDNHLIDNYIEANQYDDMVIYGFKDHYQNLTLKTALMMKWTLKRCPQARFLCKTDDDVLINPWKMKEVLRDRSDAIILGHMHNNSILIRDPNHKWYLPRWLCTEDVIPQYASGPAYVIKGEYIEDILNAAKHVPLHNIEDIYFTYHVAKKALGYELSDDVRLSSFRPSPNWFSPGCAYWPYASIHSFTPSEILRSWGYVKEIADFYQLNETSCSVFEIRFFKNIAHGYLT